MARDTTPTTPGPEGTVPRHGRPRAVRIRTGLLAAALLASLAAGGVPAARAEDGPGPDGPKGADSVEAEVKAQMEKVLRLMRENEKALLEASSLGGGKPEGVDVKPPPAEGTAGSPPAGGAKPPEGAPPPSGTEAKRRLEEALRTTESSGGAIPRELEQLVKLIPT